MVPGFSLAGVFLSVPLLQCLARGGGGCLSAVTGSSKDFPDVFSKGQNEAAEATAPASDPHLCSRVSLGGFFNITEPLCSLSR